MAGCRPGTPGKGEKTGKEGENETHRRKDNCENLQPRIEARAETTINNGWRR